MKISAIARQNYYKNISKQTLNFKGLQTVKLNKHTIVQGNTVYSIEEQKIEYSPFKDETQEEIDKFLLAHPSYTETDSSTKTDTNQFPTIIKEYNSSTIVCDRLPYTKEEYESLNKQ